MPFDYALAALVAVGLLGYLLYALLRPERFSAGTVCPGRRIDPILPRKRTCERA